MKTQFPWEVFTSNTPDKITDQTGPGVAPAWPLPESVSAQPTISLLTSYCLLEIRGPDAERFMQGQFTCDVTKITPELAGVGACCNNKGRMLALFKIAKLADQHFLLRLPAAVAASLAEHLRKYKAFFNCVCEVDPQWACIGYFGSTDPLLKTLPELPQQAGEQIVASSTVVTRSAIGSRHLELWLHNDSAQQVGEQLARNCQIAPENLWNLAEIATGTGEIYPATVDEYIPQTFNLQLQSGISFKKGCYTGQEIVARMQYLGKLKKRMYLVTVDAEQVSVADSVYSAGDKTGSIVRAERQSPASYLCLAVVDSQIETFNDQLRVGDQPAAKATLAKLPYPLPALASSRPKL